MVAPRYFITWVGSFEGRVRKGIEAETRDFIYFILESRTAEWLEFQRECHENVIKPYGEYLRSPMRTEKIEFPFAVADQVPLEMEQMDFCQRVFLRLFDVITEIRKKHLNAEITFDITAAPRAVTFIIAFLAIALSTKRSRIKLQMVPKGFEVGPKYYAPEGSDFFETQILGKDPIEKMRLCAYRRIEKDDEGGPVVRIELPIVPIDLLATPSKKREKKVSAKLVLFQQIPSGREDMKSSKDILNEMPAEDQQLILRPLKKGEQKGKDREIERAKKIWVTKNLMEFEDQGLIELEKIGKYYYARRSWAGDLLEGVVEERYNSLRRGALK